MPRKYLTDSRTTTHTQVVNSADTLEKLPLSHFMQVCLLKDLSDNNQICGGMKLMIELKLNIGAPG